MDKEIIEKINSCKEDDFYSEIEVHLDNLLTKGKLKQVEILEILNLKNYLFICDFLIKYRFFDKEDLMLIQVYILDNLNNTDRLFVSDLIEFATYWNLDLPYDVCIGFLDVNEADHHYVLLATMNYIFKKLNFEYIEQIVNKLKIIIDDPGQIQTAQVYASFILFRITLKRDYLLNLMDLVVNEDHKVLLKNILEQEYNNQRYFDYHDFLSVLCAEKQ